MTVPSTARRAGPFLGNGVATTFSFSFKTYAAGDLQVTKTSTIGVESVLVLNSDYSVALNSDQDASPGGTVTYPISGSPLASGEKLTIVGDLDYEQTTDLLGGGAFNARVIEDTFDRTVIQIQQLEERLDRTLVLPVSASGVNPTLPTPSASTVLGWNSTGTGLQNIDQQTLATIISSGTARANLFSGNGVQTIFALSNNPGVLANLDVSIGGVVQLPGIDYVWAGGTNLTFVQAPPAGTNNILVRYMQGLPTASALDIKVSNFTGTGSQTNFSLPTVPANENNTWVYVSGVFQQKNSYSLTGSTLVFSEAPPVNASIEINYI